MKIQTKKEHRMWCCPFYPFSCFLLNWPLRAIYLLFYGEVTKGQCDTLKIQLPKVTCRGILWRFALLPESTPLSSTLDSWDFQDILLSKRKGQAYPKPTSCQCYGSWFKHFYEELLLIMAKLYTKAVTPKPTPTWISRVEPWTVSSAT